MDAKEIMLKVAQGIESDPTNYNGAHWYNGELPIDKAG